MKSGNPSLNPNVFRKNQGPGESMTLNGTIRKTLFMLLLVILSAAYIWHLFSKGEEVIQFILIGAIGGFVVALIIIFVPKSAPFLAPVYSILEGMAMGGISAYYSTQFEGIVMQAVLLTFGVLFIMLMLYMTRIIKPTKKFKMGVIAATGAIFIVYVANFILGFFGITVPFLHDSGPIGIGISVVIVIVAALNLILDFDFIEQGSKMGSPKFMEWYAAFGLMITLIWLYLELLRLLAKLKND